MEIAESKSGILGENLKCKTNNGTHETQESEGGEADLQKLFDNCQKNPGHTKFVSVNDFNKKHLPEGYDDNDLFEYFKATAGLTVRVAVTKASMKRPKFWPNTKEPYPFYDKRSDVMRLGTGTVWCVDKRYNKGTCPCHNCQHSDTPREVWGLVSIHTAKHVVFDDFEATHTTCRLFYDKQDSPLVTLDGWTVSEANLEEDWCRLECLTCDEGLLKQLDEMKRHWDDLWRKVIKQYQSSRDKDKLTFIVSHPHGCSKLVSVGQWIDRCRLGPGYRTKYTYTTCTCPGSSGAHVHSMGYDCLYYVPHIHRGVNSEGKNYSATGLDLS